MYNPWKPHLVILNNEKYAIRRFRLGWEFLDHEDHIKQKKQFWWSGEYYVIKYATFTTIAGAKAALDYFLKRKGTKLARRIE